MGYYRVDLTGAAGGSCRSKPSARLVAVLLSLGEDDVLEVVGEEVVYPSRLVVSVLSNEGFEILERESDGLTYRILARKVGVGQG